jgi:hypothetical protein
VQGDNLSVDGSFVEANASKKSRIPREQLAEAAEVNQTVRQFMPRIQEASGGRYGAFLFATYAVVLGIAEFATLRSAR